MRWTCPAHTPFITGTLNTTFAPRSPLQPYSKSPHLACLSHSTRIILKLLRSGQKQNLQAFSKTARVMQQTGQKTCAEIGLSKNFMQTEKEPEFLRGERVPHADQTLQSGILWDCFQFIIGSKILSHLHCSNSNSQISQSDW